MLLKPGSGEFELRGSTLEKRFPSESIRTRIRTPLEVAEAIDKVDILATAKGGGVTGQADALRLGIARALSDNDGRLRPELKRRGFLTRDARRKERKKYGQPGARKRFQYSKR